MQMYAFDVFFRLRSQFSNFFFLFQISEGRVLAYRQVPGQLKPTIVVVPGNIQFKHVVKLLSYTLVVVRI